MLTRFQGQSLESGFSGALPAGECEIWVPFDELDRSRELLASWQVGVAGSKVEPPQLSLRALFVIITLAAVLFGWLVGLGGNSIPFALPAFCIVLFVWIFAKRWLNARSAQLKEHDD